MILHAVLAAMAALAVLVFLAPLAFGSRAAPASSRSRLSALYREELARLEDDVQEGAISPEQKEKEQGEIERRFLEQAEALEEKPRSKSALRTILGVGFLAILAPFCFALYGLLGSPDLPGAPFIGAQAQKQEREAAMFRMADALAARVKASPNDPAGWILLSRTRLALGQDSLANEAADRAFALAPDLLEAQKALAEARMAEVLRDDAPLRPDVLRLLQNLEKRSPDSLDLLYLLGHAYIKVGNVEAALSRFVRIRDSFPRESDEYQAWDEEIRRLGGAL